MGHPAEDLHSPHTGLARPLPAKITLRRTGKKALHFSGQCLAECTGYTRTAAHWYEVGLFRRDVGGYAASIRHFYKCGHLRDRFTAERFDTLIGAMRFLEEYRADADLPIGFDATSMALSAAEVTVRAAGLRARRAQYCQSYAAVCGDVLHTVETHRPLSLSA